MEFYVYCVYDPEIEAFDARLNLAPLPPEEIAEQYRRTAVKMNEAQKADAEGKKVILMGKFDDVSGKIEQSSMKVVFEFKKKDLPKEEQGQDA